MRCRPRSSGTGDGCGSCPQPRSSGAGAGFRTSKHFKDLNKHSLKDSSRCRSAYAHIARLHGVDRCHLALTASRARGRGLGASSGPEFDTRLSATMHRQRWPVPTWERSETARCDCERRLSAWSYCRRCAGRRHPRAFRWPPGSAWRSLRERTRTQARQRSGLSLGYLVG